MAVERIPKGKFTREFREEAVRMVIEDKLSVPEVGRRLQLLICPRFLERNKYVFLD